MAYRHPSSCPGSSSPAGIVDDGSSGEPARHSSPAPASPHRMVLFSSAFHDYGPREASVVQDVEEDGADLSQHQHAARDIVPPSRAGTPYPRHHYYDSPPADALVEYDAGSPSQTRSPSRICLDVDREEEALQLGSVVESVEQGPAEEPLYDTQFTTAAPPTTLEPAPVFDAPATHRAPDTWEPALAPPAMPIAVVQASAYQSHTATSWSCTWTTPTLPPFPQFPLPQFPLPQYPLFPEWFPLFPPVPPPQYQPQVFWAPTTGQGDSGGEPIHVAEYVETDAALGQQNGYGSLPEETRVAPESGRPAKRRRYASSSTLCGDESPCDGRDSDC